MYMAVNAPDNPMRLAYVSMCVMAFIMGGFYHCVADMFYYHVSGAWSVDMLIRLLVITAGNVVGGIAAERLRTVVVGN